MPKTILLPIDLNHQESWSLALPEALALVNAFGGELHIMTVLPDFGMTVVRDFFPADFEKNALQKTQSELERFAADNIPGDVRHRVHLGHGSAHAKILETAAEIGADLIVMSSRDPDHVREFFIGSNADWIVHRSPVSVLVVRG